MADLREWDRGAEATLLGKELAWTRQTYPFFPLRSSRLIETKEVSPVEATESYLDRIDDLDFKFNSYI